MQTHPGSDLSGTLHRAAHVVHESRRGSKAEARVAPLPPKVLHGRLRLVAHSLVVETEHERRDLHSAGHDALFEFECRSPSRSTCTPTVTCKTPIFERQKRVLARIGDALL